MRGSRDRSENCRKSVILKTAREKERERELSFIERSGIISPQALKTKLILDFSVLIVNVSAILKQH